MPYNAGDHARLHEEAAQLLNYAADPDPPLHGTEQKWASKLLRDKGLRPRRQPPRRKGKPKSR